jgi:hypothetical protein
MCLCDGDTHDAAAVLNIYITIQFASISEIGKIYLSAKFDHRESDPALGRSSSARLLVQYCMMGRALSESRPGSGELSFRPELATVVIQNKYNIAQMICITLLQANFCRLPV